MIGRRQIGNTAIINVVPTGLVSASGIVSDQVNFVTTGLASGVAPMAILVSFYFRTGGSAPTAGSTVQFYWARGDSYSTYHVDAGLASAMSVTPPSGFVWSQVRDSLQFCYSQPVLAQANTGYKGSFVVYDPGPKGSLVLYNETGQALNSTAANFYFRYIPIAIDVT